MEPTKKSAQNTSAFIPSSGEKPELPSLPKELMDDIFSMLSEDEMKDATTTNKFWNEKSVEYVKNEQFVSLKSLAGWLISNLNEAEIDKKNVLQAAVSDTAILKMGNLPDVKSSSDSMEKKILTVLMELDELEFINLEKKFNHENKLPKFNNLFDLVSVYKEIDIADKLPSPFERNSKICGILGKLVSLGQFKKALSLYNTLFWTGTKQIAIKNMVSAMDQNKGLYDPAQHFANVKEITNLFIKREPPVYFGQDFIESTFASLCFQLFRKNQPDKAIEIATIYSVNNILKKMVDVILNDTSYDIDEAYKIADLIKNPEVKERVVGSIDITKKYLRK